MRLTGRALGYGAVAYGAIAVLGVSAAAVAQQHATPFPKHESREYQGPQQRHRSDEDRYRRRVELGILPAPVKKAVEKAVRRVVNKAKAEERTHHEAVDPLIWLRQHQAQEQQALAYELRKRDLQFDIQYMALVRYEVERIAQEMAWQAQIAQDAEDEQILTLLMEM